MFHGVGFFSEYFLATNDVKQGGVRIAPFYTVSQKKTSPTFLAITRESIDGFL